MTDMILLDFQNSLEIIGHDVILQKLFAFGFSKQAVNLFKSYLFKQPFLINLGTKFSQPASVSCDVTQSSILGSLLFFIYVNGMSQAHKLSYGIFVCHMSLWSLCP